MAKLNAVNERIKRSYFQYLKEAKRASEASVDAAITRFEDYTKRRDFKRFRISQATGFKASLVAAISDRPGKPLAKATVNQTLAGCRTFFLWLAGRPGHRSCFTSADADHFNLSEKDVRVIASKGTYRSRLFDVDFSSPGYRHGSAAMVPHRLSQRIGARPRDLAVAAADHVIEGGALVSCRVGAEDLRAGGSAGVRNRNRRPRQHAISRPTDLDGDFRVCSGIER
ncbi:MAG: hypothetical protein OEL76_19185 [Siculibacillus sp.]|nr:hypothetical protein [Siculibacillus sp.]